MPWIQYNVQCTGLLARWQVVEVLNIVSEGAIFALGVYLVSMVRMQYSSKVQILLLFATRALVITFSALRLASLPSYFHSSNPTYSGIPTTIWAIVEVHASLVTATTPLLKSFIVQFGVLGAKPSVPVATLPQYGHAAIGVEIDTIGHEKAETGNRNREREKSSAPSRPDSKTRTEESTWREGELWLQRSDVRRTEIETTSKSDTSKSDNGSTIVRTRTASSKTNTGSR